MLLTLAALLSIHSGATIARAAECGGPGESSPLCAGRAASALPPGPADPAGSLSRASVSAATDDSVLLTVETPGRFSLRAQSGSGVALQLVDMMTGPGAIAGKAGADDGRLDVLLDRGVYKLRSFGAKGADGEAKLILTPFRAAAPVSGELLRNGAISATLSDLEQRSFWILVSGGNRISVEAAGRALKDLRLWRNGADLVDLPPIVVQAEPQPGHPVTRIRLEGDVEPGLYLATAYGGPPAVWADLSTDNPLHVRAGPPRSLAGGWFEGVIDASGSARFKIPPPATDVRLELPESAPARLSVTRAAAAPQTAAILKTSREPLASVVAPLQGNEPAIAEVTGFEGQRFALRALEPADNLKIDGTGPHLISVDVAGEGGDEAPATVLLARFAKGKGAVVVSKALRVAPGEAWRSRFNLRGPTSLIFEMTGSGPVALRTQGPGVTATLEPLLGVNAPRADGASLRAWDVEAGYYILKLEPIRDAAGVIDLTFGQPGLTPPVAILPKRNSIDFGLREIDKGAYFQIFANSAPSLVLGPVARRLPADLSAAPLVIEQKAAQLEQPRPASSETAPAAPLPPPRPPQPQPLAPPKSPDKKTPAAAGQAAPKPAQKAETKPLAKPVAKSAPPKAQAEAAPGALLVPLRAPAGGMITAVDVAGKPIAVTFLNEVADNNGRTLVAAIAPADHDRRVIVAWSKAAPLAAVPAIPPASALLILAPGEPRFLDLAREETREFNLDVVEGGLYRIETLGRLKTSAAIGTSFKPSIDSASDNGAGHNALLQIYLRAGRYRIAIKALGSEGRLGVVARRAVLNDAGTLAPEQSAKAALGNGAGALFDVVAPQAAPYQLDLYSLGEDFSARLEDAEGWPLTPPGPMTQLRQSLDKGRYRLVVPPVESDARVVARLRDAREPESLMGHGPHPLAFEAPAKLQWREPADSAAPREPDRWTFALAGPAQITLGVSDGMSAELMKSGADGTPLARLSASHGFAGELAAGDYVVEARAIGRNDRLDYTLTLTSVELQPGAPRSVNLPATVPFRLAAEHIVNLTSFGAKELTGVLKDAEGRTIERLAGSVDDWNLGFARRLPAGAYRLELAAMDGGAASREYSGEPEADSANEESTEDATDGDSASSDDQNEATGDAAAEEQPIEATRPARNAVELRVSLPETMKGPDLDLEGVQRFKGAGARQMALPAVAAGALLVVAVESSSDSALSLERQETAGAWRVLGQDRGRAPVVAIPSDGDENRPLRVTLWPLDGEASMAVAARAVDPRESLRAPELRPLAIEGMSPPVLVAAVGAPAKSLVRLGDAPDGLRQGSAPGRVLTEAGDGVLAPQSERLWFIKRGGAGALAVAPLPSNLREIELDLAAGDVATLTQPKAGEGSLRVWRARSSFGQPGLSAGKGMGVLSTGPVGEALALNGGEALRVWNAGDDGALRVSLKAFDLMAQPMAAETDRFAATLPVGVVQMVALPAGGKEIEINLGPGAGAVLNGGFAPATIFGGDSALSRRLTGAWTRILLFNIGSAPAPASFASAPAPNDKPLAAGAIMKRFFGAAGSSALRVEAAAGDRLVTAGAHTTFVGDAGAVLRGGSLILPGPGAAILDHDAGLLAAWVENADQSPWPRTEPQSVAPPQRVALGGAAMKLRFAVAAPGLLVARSDAPVILALSSNGVLGEPTLFPAGAEFRAYAPAGDAELNIYSPHDGPLSGALSLALDPLIPINEGVGAAQTLGPGDAALFAFDLPRAATIGVGVRSNPDSARVRLLDESGRSLGEGVAQLQRLQPGRYIIEARAPADGATLTVRPALVGLTPPSDGPPPDVAQHYLELVGLKPSRAP
ncbi:hypothetical protein CR492_03635 [Methylocella silvestris]|uniref:Uncharacterized protein n=1 Tax=Methylocella silvestris TaxID=199596 RepID=A0A2J7TK98_METSI|nr:hypothetical protein CR492_03635 [Methylocella silvestris]